MRNRRESVQPGTPSDLELPYTRLDSLESDLAAAESRVVGSEAVGHGRNLQHLGDHHNPSAEHRSQLAIEPEARRKAAVDRHTALYGN